MYHTRGTGRQDTSGFDPVGIHVEGMGVWRLVALQNGGYKCFFRKMHGKTQWRAGVGSSFYVAI
jgi:hypothetical protein